MSIFRQFIPMISLHIHTHSSYSSLAKTSYYLRKKRKCPFSQYNCKVEETFSHQLAMQKLINSLKNSPKSNLLSVLVNSFASYQRNPTLNSYFFILKIITKNPTTWDQIPLFIDYINKVENFNTKDYLFNYLIKFYGDLKQPHLAFKLFFINPSVKSLNSLIWLFFENHVDLKVMLLVIVKCQRLNLYVEESTFEILIKGFCKIGKWKIGFDLLNLMVVDNGFNLDERICSLILFTICEGEFVQFEKIWGVFEDMRSLGFNPKKVDICNLIRFCVKNANGVDVLDVLNKLKLNGMALDIVCYNLVLNKLILDGEFDYADEVFDELLVLGLVPNIVTYNVYINGLCKQNKVDEALKMITCMESAGCKPEMNTYYTILEGLCMNGEVVEACNMLHEMVDGGFVCKSKSIIFDGLMQLLCQRGLFDEAMELLSLMVNKNVVPGIRSWEVLVQSTSPAQNFDEVVKLAQHGVTLPKTKVAAKS